MSTVFLTKYNPDSLFRTGGISQHTSLQTKKTMFNSTFLAQYDSHFNSIQQIYTQNILFKLLQSTLPDAAVTRTVAENLRLKTSKYAYLMDRRAELGDLSLGASSNTSTSINVVLKLLYHYRFKKLRRSSKHLHVFMDQKFSGSGFLKSGRHAPNFRRNIRYGAFVRASVWSFYSGAFLAYSQTGPKSKNFGYVQFTTQNLTKKPSAFFRRNSSFVKFSSGYTRHTLLVVMLSAVTALRTVWFKTAQYLHLRRIISTSSLVNYENFKHHEMLRFGFRAFGRFRVAPTGSGMQRGTDLIIQSRLASSKKHLKHHSRRLGFTWYEKKLWGYRKNHRYWRYMQWVAHFYFRGLAYHRLFYMRLDVFLVYHLRVRNIRHARLLVTGGHAFIGDIPCFRPYQPVNPMTVVSISRYARRWLNFYFNRLTGWKTATYYGYGLLVFGRYFENAYIYGPGCTFAIPYGDPLDILWAKRAGKAGFFAFSYFQGQKTVSSAWW